MSKITIIEGNNNDKNNVRAFMVKGERGDPGVSPTIDASKSGKETTITITNGDETTTTVINDGLDLTGGVPTSGVIAFDGDAADIPGGYEVSPTSFATITDSYSTSTTEGYSANYINGALIDTYSTDEVKTNKVWIDGQPIYRKVIQYSNRMLAGDVEIPHGIHNFKTLTKIEIITFYDNKYYATPLIYNNVSNASYINYVNTSNIVLKLGENWDLYNMNIILEYTKTTD